MKDLNVYNIKRCLPRMSWHPRNLYNLWRRSSGDKSAGTDFRQSRSTLFQARWQSKALVRAYHGDFINEGIFKRWYLPQTLPDVRPRRQLGRGDDRMELAAMAGRGRDVHREVERVKEDERHALAPVGSLMFGEVERRIDVFLFRCCFAHSVYEARRLVIHGDVKLNGVKIQDANTRLAPGDMVSVDPAAIRFLRPSKTIPSSIFAPEAPKKDAANANSSKAQPTKSAWEEVLTLSEEKDEPTTSASSEESSPEASKSDTEPEAPSDPRLKGLTPFHLPPYAAPHLFLPAYAEVSFATCSAVLVRLPTARAEYSEIPTPYEADGEVVRFAWEWYAGRRPRVRSARQRAQSPINRQRADEPVVGRN